VPVTIHRAGGKTEQITVTCGIFTLDEVEYFRNGGILHYVLRNLAKAG
jgi:aconitate hydratase